ncbi:MAG: hypothetical protein VR64_16875 [Desulfatitalea sp. BRH_c12]|nr:MAG: hypothetical protein VR64_16875 [Desulfatitalea sp. BRH_c12]
MGYHFKLEALRQFRQFTEERLQKELALAQRVLEQSEAILNDSIAKREKTEAAFRQTPQAPLAGMYRHFLERVAEDITLQSSKVQAARTACEEKRDELLTAMKKRKTLDRLKEKGQQAFTADLNGAEEKFVNEIALNRYTRKSG